MPISATAWLTSTETSAVAVACETLLELTVVPFPLFVSAAMFATSHPFARFTPFSVLSLGIADDLVHMSGKENPSICSMRSSMCSWVLSPYSPAVMQSHS